MKIRIEKAGCVAYARCAAVAEAPYLPDDEGYIATEGFDLPPGQELLARRGARACPQRIIHVEKAAELHAVTRERTTMPPGTGRRGKP